MTLYYCGIDPGANGAVALIPGVGVVGDPIAFSGDAYIQAKTLADWRSSIVFAAIERPFLMPGQAVSSTSAQWYNYGYVRGSLSAFSIQHTAVLARHWQKQILPGKPIPTPAKGSKKISAENRRKLKAYVISSMRCHFPEFPIKNDGVADALALALYARSLGG